MTSTALGFELSLLHCMSRPYEVAVLGELGLKPEEVERVRSQCPMQMPAQLDSPVGAYVAILGQPHRSEALPNAPEPFSGSTAYSFILALWPHLYWVVNEGPAGRSWGVGFQNQADLRFRDFDPALVRPGLWTRSVLERLAERHELHDGWDDHVVERFTFGGRPYEGSFALGLLQQWRAL